MAIYKYRARTNDGRATQGAVEAVTESDETNKNLSGYWLIKSMNHVMKETVWNSYLVLVKDSYKNEKSKSRYKIKNKLPDKIDNLDKVKNKIKSIRGII